MKNRTIILAATLVLCAALSSCAGMKQVGSKVYDAGVKTCNVVGAVGDFPVNIAAAALTPVAPSAGHFVKARPVSFLCDTADQIIENLNDTGTAEVGFGEGLSPPSVLITFDIIAQQEFAPRDERGLVLGPPASPTDFMADPRYPGIPRFIPQTPEKS